LNGVSEHRRRQALALLATALLLPGLALAVSTARDEAQSALRLRPDLDRGAMLFEVCAACHGERGQGASDGSVPEIAGQPVSVLVKQLVDFRHDVRPDVRMEHFVSGERMNPQQIADVAAYIRSLRPVRSLRDSDPSAAQAEGLYMSSCASCHGPRAAADAANALPRLAGQHPEYLLQELEGAAQGRRPTMTRDHAPLVMQLSSQQLQAIARYLAHVDPRAAEDAAAD